jgi:hypothetical protein
VPTEIKKPYESKFDEEKKIHASAFGVTGGAAPKSVGLGCSMSVGMVVVAAMVVMAL